MTRWPLLPPVALLLLTGTLLWQTLTLHDQVKALTRMQQACLVGQHITVEAVLPPAPAPAPAVLVYTFDGSEQVYTDYADLPPFRDFCERHCSTCDTVQSALSAVVHLEGRGCNIAKEKTP